MPTNPTLTGILRVSIIGRCLVENVWTEMYRDSSGDHVTPLCDDISGKQKLQQMRMHLNWSKLQYCVPHLDVGDVI